MGFTVTGDGVEVTESIERRVAEHVNRLKDLFASEPDVDVHFSAANGKIVAEVIVPVRGYRTLRAKAKAEDVDSALQSAAKKAEWKYRLFWTRGSFRFSDCC